MSRSNQIAKRRAGRRADPALGWRRRHRLGQNGGRIRSPIHQSSSSMKSKSKDSGKLRIGDDWNAIRIIALSQSNPLKAIAEFVENSIDAHAKTITIIRGKEHGAHYLSIKDDGDGVPRDTDGLPDFNTNQQWTFTTNPDGTYSVRNRSTGL